MEHDLMFEDKTFPLNVLKFNVGLFVFYKKNILHFYFHGSVYFILGIMLLFISYSKPMSIVIS